ncbi:hypothetical protein PQ459_07460 [Chryseobacterium sp. KACC 21268]|nr:hypothetical protein PQ459_07460 [Chryseobacterium sp. KACC 21268]
MSFAQFTDNVFDQNQSTSGASKTEANPGTYNPNETEQTSSSIGVPGPGDHEEAPGNPGEPVPINGYIPVLLLAGLTLIIYYQKKNKKINI